MTAQVILANALALAIIAGAVAFVVIDAIRAARAASDRKARLAAQAARLDSPEYRNAAFVASLLWAQGNAARVNGQMPAAIYAAWLAAARKRDALARY